MGDLSRDKPGRCMSVYVTEWGALMHSGGLMIRCLQTKEAIESKEFYQSFVSQQLVNSLGQKSHGPARKTHSLKIIK